MILKYLDEDGYLTLRKVVGPCVLKYDFGTWVAWLNDKLDFEIYGCSSEPIIKNGVIDYATGQEERLDFFRGAVDELLNLDDGETRLDDGAMLFVRILDFFSKDAVVKIAISAAGKDENEHFAETYSLSPKAIQRKVNELIAQYEESKKEHLANHE